MQQVIYLLRRRTGPKGLLFECVIKIKVSEVKIRVLPDASVHARRYPKVNIFEVQVLKKVDPEK